MSIIAKTALFLVFFSAGLSAQELKWPKMMHTSENINKSIFRGLKNYFDRLAGSKIVHWLDDNHLIVYEGSEVVFNAKMIATTSADADCDAYMVNFIGREGQVRRVRVNTCPLPEAPLSLKDFLRGSFLGGAENFQVLFYGWNFSIRGRANKDGKQTVYESHRGSTRIILNERASSDRLYSELYYSCESCLGDAIVATLSMTPGGSIVEGFYAGMDGAPVDAKNFYQSAGGYLNYPLAFMPIMLDDAQYTAGWPSL